MKCPATEIFFPVIVDNSFSLMKMIHIAVGGSNLERVDPRIIPERFKINKSDDVRKVRLKLKAPREGETCRDAAFRLEGEGYILENIYELAIFLAEYPEEVENTFSVLALGYDSRWTYVPDIGIYVPCASVSAHDSERYFDMFWFHSKLYHDHRILVSGGPE